MFERISYSIQLRRLRTQHKSLLNEHDKVHASLRAFVGEDTERARHAAEIKSITTRTEYLDRLEAIQTKYFLNVAERYFLPPPLEADWEKGTYWPQLTREASARLRAAIRSERKERWEQWYKWIPLLAAFTGVLGTIIGVISALKK